MIDILEKNWIFVINNLIFSCCLGGCNFQTVRMEILVNGSTVISRTGNCQPQMKRTKVDLKQFVGSIARVKLVDLATDNWGYLAFDDLRHGTTCEGIWKYWMVFTWQTYIHDSWDLNFNQIIWICRVFSWIEVCDVCDDICEMGVSVAF